MLEIDSSQLWRRPATGISAPKFYESVFGSLDYHNFDEYANRRLADAEEAVYLENCVQRNKRLIPSPHGIRAYCYEKNYDYSASEVMDLYAECSATTNYLIDICLKYQKRCAYLKTTMEWILGSALMVVIGYFYATM